MLAGLGLVALMASSSFRKPYDLPGNKKELEDFLRWCECHAPRGVMVNHNYEFLCQMRSHHRAKVDFHKKLEKMQKFRAFERENDVSFVTFKRNMQPQPCQDDDEDVEAPLGLYPLGDGPTAEYYVEDQGWYLQQWPHVNSPPRCGNPRCPRRAGYGHCGPDCGNFPLVDDNVQHSVGCARHFGDVFCDKECARGHR